MGPFHKPSCLHGSYKSAQKESPTFTADAQEHLSLTPGFNQEEGAGLNVCSSWNFTHCSSSSVPRGFFSSPQLPSQNNNDF